MNIFVVIIIMIVATLIGSLGSIFLKLGAAHFTIRFTFKNLIHLFRNWRLILGIFLYALSTIPFIYLLRSVELSVLYPLTALGYIFVIFFSRLILKEHITSYKIVGILFIILGVIFVTL